MARKSRLRLALREVFGHGASQQRSSRAERVGPGPNPGIDSGLGRTLRDVTGPFGPANFRGKRINNTLETIVDSNSAYRQSFNRQLPPSTFVSERDRLRFGQAVPVSERLIGDTAATRRLKKDLDQL
ncbi:MAG: hypothetical protein GXP35_02840 [Actinobacteria bacterium]|nr:hypothetical protein [Actinomycetota bacterium]